MSRRYQNKPKPKPNPKPKTKNNEPPISPREEKVAAAVGQNQPTFTVAGHGKGKLLLFFLIKAVEKRTAS